VFRSFTIRNFRGFRELDLSGLERVNLIAGRNNVGKTALLEALFLHIGANNPQLTLSINVFRGIEQFAAEPGEMWAGSSTASRLTLLSSWALSMRQEPLAASPSA
jgi:hypothetical protein